MDSDAYRRVTNHLIDFARSDDRALGLVALGSMAEVARTPDEWSDHDFWLIVRPGTAESLRTDPGWLPDPDRIVLFFRETPHGMKVLYDDAHLMEPAVFEPDELAVARANEYRVLVDKGGIAVAMAEVATRTDLGGGPTDGYLFGQFLTNLLVGVGRWARGERQSGRTFVAHYAVEHLLRLAARRGIADRPEAIDDLDPHRRIEIALPAFAVDLAAALEAPIPTAAERLLGLAQYVAPALFVQHEDAVLAVEARIRSVAAGTTAAPRALHHVQLAIPPGGEDAARRFYGSLLQMTEIPKPPELARRGGCWFRSTAAEIHLGVEDPFRPARKAHPGLLVDDLDTLVAALDDGGHPVTWDGLLPGYRRCYVDDPFGNRIELLMPVA